MDATSNHETAMLSQYTPEELMEAMREDSDEMHYRRGMACMSALSIAAMIPVSLLQLGVVDHLPDPPVGNFNSDKVNLSEDAFKTGVPDGPISLASMGLNLILAGMGGPDRARRHPWLPIAIAGKAVVEAAVASTYFYKMPAKEKTWCPYCVVGMVANIGVAAYAVPEALKAIRYLRDEAL